MGLISRQFERTKRWQEPFVSNRNKPGSKRPPLYESGEDSGGHRILRVAMNNTRCEPQRDPKNDDQNNYQYEKGILAIQRENAR